MSSSLGNFGRTAKMDSKRKRLQRVSIGLLVVLAGGYLLQPLFIWDTHPNLSIMGSSGILNNGVNMPESASSQDIPWNNLLIPPNELGRMDYFSDSWFMNRENFLQINVETIETVEEACFQVIDADATRTSNKMFADWTNFSVEHLSKWWKRLNTLTHSNSGISDHVVHKLHSYLHKVRDAKKQKHSTIFPKQTAIGMIAFQSYESVASVGPERGHLLTAHSLAATIASLYQVGFHRIVVGGYQQNDSHRVQEGFQILESVFENTDISSKQDHENAKELEPSLQMGDTQVTYVRLEQSWVQTKRVSANIPRGMLFGMQKALRNEFVSKEEQAKWIGHSPTTSESWQYFYLTEPDTILNTKPEILPLLKSGLDKGWVFFPHRWQPIPHEADLPSGHVSYLSPSRYIPQNVAPFSNITTFTNPWMVKHKTMTTPSIAYDGDIHQGISHCCDTGMEKPGRSEAFGIRFKPCGKWWWACGYSSANPPGKPLTSAEVLDLHKRLVPYPMMRLDGGTSVIVAASEFGRRCLPSKVECEAPPS